MGFIFILLMIPVLAGFYYMISTVLEDLETSKKYDEISKRHEEAKYQLGHAQKEALDYMIRANT